MRHKPRRARPGHEPGEVDEGRQARHRGPEQDRTRSPLRGPRQAVEPEGSRGEQLGERRHATSEPRAGRALNRERRPGEKPRLLRATPWWWRPRVRSAVLLSGLGVVSAGARLYTHFQTEWLWFHEVGQERVFWTVLASRWVAGAAIGSITALVLLGNFLIVDRAAGAPLRRALLAAYATLSVGAGIVAGAVVGVANWQRVVLWLHQQHFGVADPEFHRDVGFFVFSLPLYQQLTTWLVVLVGVALATAVVGYVANGVITLRPRPVITTPAARAHVLVLGATLLLISAARHRLSEFGLEVPHPGAELPGGYTDLHVQLAWLRVLIVLSLLAAATLLVSAVRRRPSVVVPIVTLTVMAVAELVGPATLPSLVQRYLVDPQTLTRERPYIGRQIRFTQLAYALTSVAERQLPADAATSPDALRAHRGVLDNVQLWDPRVLQADIDEHQSIGSYYSLPNITVDRYREDGADRALLLSERELDLQRLEPSGRTWANDRLAYTHGYGLVAVPAGEADDAGRAVYTNAEFAPGSSATRVGQPRLYFGIQPQGAQPWVITRTGRSEVEKPLSGAKRAPEEQYRGAGGFPVGGPASRAVLALRFGDLNLLISPTLREDSRLMLHRDVRDRVRTLAPFLSWEDRPQVAVIGGRITFLLYGYTTSDSYPYATRVAVHRREVNYMREAAVATVDAFSGHVALYATGSEPILRAWQRAFPTLFAPLEHMPASARAHLRYPQALFDTQARVWATYHADDIEDFYTRVDDWQAPADLSGPLDRVGSIRFRPRSADAISAPRVRPSYELGRLPGDRRERFLLSTTYTPHGQENMTGYLAGFVDGGGQPRLAQLTLPRSRLTLGPAQIARRILATPEVGDRLRLLNAETTDLGDRAVDAVQLGEPRVVPIADSFLYVMPIYVTAAGHGVTRLRLVTVFLNGSVGWGRDLDEAIARAQQSPGAQVRRRRVAAPPAGPDRSAGAWPVP